MCARWLIAVAALAVIGWARPDDGSDRAADEEMLKRAGVDISDEALLEFFRRRTLKEADTDRIRLLIKQLGDDVFEVRERASAGLLAIGAPAEAALRDARQNSDVEVVRRAEDCLRLIKRGASGAVASSAARLLAKRNATGAADALLGYLPFTDDEAVAQDVRDALAGVAARDGKLNPAVLAGLSDKSAIRRGAAAEALCRAGFTEHAQLKSLVNDPDPGVRLHVGVGLVSAKKKEGVPVLIDLVGKLTPEKTWMLEEVLLRLAGENAPVVLPVNGEPGTDKARQAWAAWWRDHGEQLDFAKLSEGQPFGFTLIMFLDIGRVLELDAQNKIRWEYGGLDFPLDVQYLPNNRVLFAEHRGQKVTERDLKGNIVWEHRFESPIVAQRLPNGNTFMVNHERMAEVTRDGKEVFTYTPPNGEQISKAQKLRNGQIAFIVTSQGSRFVQIDGTGKELHSFPVKYHTSGGRIDVLPNGNVLIPEHRDNRVVEFSPDGNEVWSATVELPIAAVRLPSGNTLVTSMSQKRAVELDRRGQQVWEYKAETRVTRAYRR